MNQHTPLISIIIPYYNCEKYITETLESVEKQTYHNYEVILVNDGSSASSTAYIEQLVQDKGYIQYFYQHNSGASSARNHGAKYAKGKFLLFLDGDDIIHPTYLQKTANILLNNPNCKLVYTRTEFFDSQHGIWKLPHYTGFKSLLLGNKIVITALIYKSDFNLLSGFDEHLKSHEDWDYWIRLLKDGGDVCYIDESLFFYRKRADQSSHTDGLIKNHNFNTVWQAIYDKHKELFMAHQLAYVNLAHYYQLAQQAIQANHQLAEALKQSEIQRMQLLTENSELKQQIIQLKNKTA